MAHTVQLMYYGERCFVSETIEDVKEGYEDIREPTSHSGKELPECEVEYALKDIGFINSLFMHLLHQTQLLELTQSL